MNATRTVISAGGVHAGPGGDYTLPQVKPLTDLDRARIDAVRELIAHHPGLFRKAGEWFDTDYAMDEIDRRTQAQAYNHNFGKGYRDKSPEESSIPYLRLKACIKDFHKDAPNLAFDTPRQEREEKASRIVYVTWLASDPDAIDVAPGFSDIEQARWEGDSELGRWWVFMDARQLSWFSLPFVVEAIEVMQKKANSMKAIGEKQSGCVTDTALNRINLRKLSCLIPPMIKSNQGYFEDAKKCLSEEYSTDACYQSDCIFDPTLSVNPNEDMSYLDHPNQKVAEEGRINAAKVQASRKPTRDQWVCGFPRLLKAVQDILRYGNINEIAILTEAKAKRILLITYFLTCPDAEKQTPGFSEFQDLKGGSCDHDLIHSATDSIIGPDDDDWWNLVQEAIEIVELCISHPPGKDLQEIDERPTNSTPKPKMNPPKLEGGKDNYDADPPPTMTTTVAVKIFEVSKKTLQRHKKQGLRDMRQKDHAENAVGKWLVSDLEERFPKRPERKARS